MHGSSESREIASSKSGYEVLVESDNCELVVYKDPYIGISYYLAIRQYETEDKKNFHIYGLAPLTSDYKIDTEHDMYRAYIKKDGNTFKNSFYRVGNNSGIHEFSFESVDNVKTIKKFKAIQSFGWGHDLLFPVLNLTRKTITECNF